MYPCVQITLNFPNMAPKKGRKLVLMATSNKNCCNNTKQKFDKNVPS